MTLMSEFIISKAYFDGLWCRELLFSFQWTFMKRFPVRPAFKWIVHPKTKFLTLITHPSHRSRPVRPSFIFRTHIKITFMKSESFLTLHRWQHSYQVQDLEIEQGHFLNSPCDICGSTVILCGYERTFFYAKKTKITLFNNFFFPMRLQHAFTRVPRPWNKQFAVFLRVRMLKNILICVPRRNEGLTGLE